MSARIDCPGLDKAQGVLPFIFGVERTLAPRPHADGTGGDTVYFFARETAKRLRTGEDGVKVLDRKIQCLGCRVWLANRRYVDHLQCDRTTGEVAARTRLCSPLEPEQLTVKVRRLVEVSHLDIDAKQARCVRNDPVR